MHHVWVLWISMGNKGKKSSQTGHSHFIHTHLVPKMNYIKIVIYKRKMRVFKDSIEFKVNQKQPWDSFATILLLQMPTISCDVLLTSVPFATSRSRTTEVSLYCNLTYPHFLTYTHWSWILTVVRPRSEPISDLMAPSLVCIMFRFSGPSKCRKR